MKETEFLRSLRATSKAFFTVSDLQKVTGLERKSLYVSLNRWVDRGLLARAGRNIYIIAGERPSLEVIASQSYFPCYLSFETALSRFGILNLVPYSLSFATTRKTKSVVLSDRRVDYRHIKPELYFGFTQEQGFYLAEPEKALLDLIYLAAFGKASIPVDELDLRSLSDRTLRKYARRFPPRVIEALERLK